MRRFLSSMFLLCLFALRILAIDSGAQNLIDAGHWKRLHYLAETRLKSNPNDAEANFLLAYAKLSFNDPDKAIELSRKAVALDGSKADYHYLLGRAIGQKASRVGILKGIGMAGEFRKENNLAISINPNHIEALSDLMDYYFEAPGIAGGDKRKAYEMAERIGKINAVRGFLAQADLASRDKPQDWNKIEGLYRKAMEADPTSYQAHVALANICASDIGKQYDEGERLAREALKIDPGRQGAYSLLATIDVHMERWQDLDALLALAEKNVSDSLNAYYQAARVLQITGKDLPRAERYLAKYLSQPAEGNSPRWAAAHWRLGLVLEKEGRKPEAVAEIRVALNLEPDFEPAKKDLQRLK